MNKSNGLREQLAEIEHQRWADWQVWCHKILREGCPSPELEKILERWDRQIQRDYVDLSEQEKDSDREQVDRYLPLIIALIDSEVIGIDEKERRFWASDGTIKPEDYFQSPEMKARNNLRDQMRTNLKKLMEDK